MFYRPQVACCVLKFITVLLEKQGKHRNSFLPKEIMAALLRFAESNFI